MATYPTAVYAPRTKANRTGVVYDAAKTTVGYAEDMIKLDAEVVAVETELGLLPKGTSASVLEKIKGLRSLSDATADTIIVKGGNVGIGTTAPGAKLVVKDAVNQQFLVSVDGTNGTYLYGGSSGTQKNWLIGGPYNVHEGFEITPSTANGGSTFSTPVATFTSGGNVGIGITSPTAKLHLAAGTASANTAPLKFSAGVVNTTPVLGAVEFIDDGTNGHLYITLNVGGTLTRKEIAFV